MTGANTADATADVGATDDSTDGNGVDGLVTGRVQRRVRGGYIVALSNGVDAYVPTLRLLPHVELRLRGRVVVETMLVGLAVIGRLFRFRVIHTWENAPPKHVLAFAGMSRLTLSCIVSDVDSERLLGLREAALDGLSPGDRLVGSVAVVSARNAIVMVDGAPFHLPAESTVAGRAGGVDLRELIFVGDEIEMEFVGRKHDRFAFAEVGEEGRADAHPTTDATGDADGGVGIVEGA